MARPTLLPSWATSSSAEVSQPNDGQRIAGFISGSVVSTGFVNWLFKYLWTWIAYLDKATTPFSTLNAAYDAIDNGEVTVVYEDDSTVTAPGSQINTYMDPSEMVALATNGRYLVRASASGHPVVCGREAPATIIRTLTRPSAGTNRAMYAQGDWVAVAYGTRCTVFRISTGVAVWTVDHGANVNDVWIGGGVVLLGGIASAGVTVRGIRQSDGTQLWTYAHGGAVWSVAGDNSQAFIGGAAGTGGYNLRSLSLFSGTSISTSFDVILASGDIAHPRCIVSDGDGLFVGASTSVYRLNRTTGGIVAEMVSPVFTTTDALALSVDHGGLFALIKDAATANVIMHRVSKSDLGIQWLAGSLTTFSCMVTDGARIWAGFTYPVGTGPGLASYARRNRPGSWLKIAGDGAINQLQYPWIMQPFGEE